MLCGATSKLLQHLQGQEVSESTLGRCCFGGSLSLMTVTAAEDVGFRPLCESAPTVLSGSALVVQNDC